MGVGEVGVGKVGVGNVGLTLTIVKYRLKGNSGMN